MNRKKINIFIIIFISGYFLMQAKAMDGGLPAITLNGDNGGVCGGKEWNSASLKDKVNLVLYVDPDKQSWVKPLVIKLDSLCYSPDSLGITFILNTDATILPDFVIRNRVKAKAEASENITYVLDRKKILVKKWGLIDDNINILLVDLSGRIITKHHGEMSAQFINQFIERINESLSIKGR